MVNSKDLKEALHLHGKGKSTKQVMQMVENYAQQKVEEAIEIINNAYPAVFPHEVQYGKAVMKHGKYTPLAIVRLTEDEEEMLKNIIRILSINR